MTKDVIEYYDTFNTIWCPDELIFGDFNDKTIPSEYYNFLNDDNGDANNITGTPVENVLLENKWVEDAAVPNEDDINDEITIEDNDSLASYIYSLQK